MTREKLKEIRKYKNIKRAIRWNKHYGYYSLNLITCEINNPYADKFVKMKTNTMNKSSYY